MIYKQPKEATTGLTYTRSGAATAWRKDGTLAEFAPNVIRRTDRGVLIEGQATNLVRYSRQGSAEPGGNVAVPVANSNHVEDGRACMSGTFPVTTDGHINKCQVLFGGVVRVQKDLIYSWAATIKLSRPLVGDESVRVWFAGWNDLGHVTITASSQQNGWSRVGATRTSIATGDYYLYVIPMTLLSPLTVYCTDIQLEQTSYTSSPIITTGAAATRGADSLVVPVPALSGPSTLITSAESLPDGGSLFRATSPDGFNNLSVSRQGGRVVLQIPGGQSTTAPAPGGPVKVTVLRDGGVYRWAMNGVVMPPLALDPERLKGGNQGFEDGLTGWGPNIAANPGVYTDANRPAFFSNYQGRSNVVAITLGMGRRYTNSVKLYPIDTARKYRFRGAIYAGAGSSNHAGIIGYLAYDADNKRIGQAHPVMAGDALPPNTGWHDRTSSIVTGEGPNQFTQFPPGTKKIQLYSDLNYYGQKLDVEMALDGIWLEDVTETDLPMDRVHAFPQLNSYGRELLTFPYALTDEELVKLTSPTDTTFDHLSPGGVHYYDAGQTAMPRKSQVAVPISSGRELIL